MIIGVCGPACSGKSSLANYLVTSHQFGLLRLKPSSLTNPSSYLSSFQPACSSLISPLQDSLSNQRHPTSVVEFENAVEMLEYVMAEKRWRLNWVVLGITSVNTVKILRKRPFFLLIAVDSPMMSRYHRFLNRLPPVYPHPTLECFVAKHDASVFGTLMEGLHQGGLCQVLGQADIHIVNNLPTVSDFYRVLDKMDLVNGERIRPSWDAYYSYLCHLAAKRSNCMKRSVGCILVKDNRVIATGYNGTPSSLPNCNMGGCPRCNNNSKCGVGLDTCLCIHAEENALLEAGRERISGGYVVLYCSTCPCLGCAKKIVQARVSEVVFGEDYAMDSMTSDLFRTAGIKLRQHKHVGLGLEMYIGLEVIMDDKFIEPASMDDEVLTEMASNEEIEAHERHDAGRDNISAQKTKKSTLLEKMVLLNMDKAHENLETVITGYGNMISSEYMREMT